MVDIRPADREGLPSGGAGPMANPAASLARTIDGRDKLSPETVARIEANKEAARKRKAARLLAIKNFIPTPTVATDLLAKGQAPPTAPRAGGLPEISNRRCRETKGREADGHNGPTWPNDQPISLSDASHRNAGFSAIDAVNPNAWSAGADYMHRTTADVVLTQEVRLPEGEPCRAAEQAARNAKSRLATEPCLVTGRGATRPVLRSPPAATSA